jgi:hypothetical protein
MPGLIPRRKHILGFIAGKGCVFATLGHCRDLMVSKARADWLCVAAIVQRYSEGATPSFLSYGAINSISSLLQQASLMGSGQEMALASAVEPGGHGHA